MEKLQRARGRLHEKRIRARRNYVMSLNSLHCVLSNPIFLFCLAKNNVGHERFCVFFSFFLSSPPLLFFFFQLYRALLCAASPGHNPLVVTTSSNGH